MTIEEINKRKKEYGFTNEDLARLSGVPLSTVQKVLGGITKSPRYQTIEALSAVFPEPVTSETRSGNGQYRTYSESSVLSDPSGAYAARTKAAPAADMDKYPYPEDAPNRERYPRQGTYTLEDYLALPDEQRVELIDGVFYDMSAPTLPHQLIGGELHAILREFLNKKKGQCMAFMSPVDVQLDRDNKTIVQPDVMVVCDRTKMTRARIFGAPDFIVEVLSPSTRNKDILIKMRKYKEAGVREYWMIDEKNRSVIKICFELPDQDEPDGNIKIETYPYEMPVPVSIFNNELSINFAEIEDTYSFLNESDRRE